MSVVCGLAFDLVSGCFSPFEEVTVLATDAPQHSVPVIFHIDRVLVWGANSINPFEKVAIVVAHLRSIADMRAGAAVDGLSKVVVEGFQHCRIVFRRFCTHLEFERARGRDWDRGRTKESHRLHETVAVSRIEACSAHRCSVVG